jgi:tetratricopeptide (TPR) repeat protein
LPAAIEAEVRADFPRAIREYEGLADHGYALDRIGIFQALARCHEKMGHLAEAAPWRRKAAQGYMALSDEEMPRDERRYYALVEARNAVQDLAGHSDLGDAAGEYKTILAENWKGGPEGLTHEGLFGALLFRSLGDWVTAAKYAFDVAEAVNEQATETGGDPLKRLSLVTYELAEELATKAGRMDVARVAALRATALRGGPRVQVGGL